MTHELWASVDSFLADCIAPPDPLLENVLAASEAAGLPSIHVSPNQGRFLGLLARLIGARRILEVGTLAGYSTICLARSLPSAGRLITLELEPRHAELARSQIHAAGLADLVEVIVGPALESLSGMISGNSGPFDLIFIDADKEQMLEYFEAALALSRPGTVIIIDNVVREGAVIDPDSEDPRVQGVRRFLAQLKSQPHFDCTALQIVGSKGYDGFLIGRVTESPAPLADQ